MLDKGKFKYSHVSIVQASNLKERLEELKINRDKVTIASVDAINMCINVLVSAVCYLYTKGKTGRTENK